MLERLFERVTCVSGGRACGPRGVGGADGFGCPRVRTISARTPHPIGLMLVPLRFSGDRVRRLPRASGARGPHASIAHRIGLYARSEASETLQPP